MGGVRQPEVGVNRYTVHVPGVVCNMVSSKFSLGPRRSLSATSAYCDYSEFHLHTSTPQYDMKAIDLLPGQASQLFANLHPVLLLSSVIFSFRSLVGDPVSTLLRLAPTLLLLQAIYCIVCLPSSGQTAPTKPRPGQKTKNVKPAQDTWARLVVW